MQTRFFAALAGLVLLPLAAPGARAAESYDNCTGFITSLPAVISTQGTWCLDRDLSTGIVSGVAITLANNNITLDCNHFKLGGLAAGAGTDTYGIQAQDRLNATIRNCNIRGFKRGLSFFGAASAGHVVEDNRIEASTSLGIFMGGTGNVVRRNRILDTGGTTQIGTTMGLFVAGNAEVIDNSIDGVSPAAGGSVFGVYGAGISSSTASVIQGNRVTNLQGGEGEVVGIAIYSGDFVTLDRNILGPATGTAGTSAIYCWQPGSLTGNLSHGFDVGLNGCSDDGGNVHK